jgi:transglutaminase-like putative cysteine protease
MANTRMEARLGAKVARDVRAAQQRARRLALGSPPVRVAARVGRGRSQWEPMVRYGAGYTCTLVSVAAAQLVIRTEIALFLALLTLAGLPLSLWLRATHGRIGGFRLSRPMVNFGVMLVTLFVAASILATQMPSLEMGRFFQLASATQSVSLLMQLFLIFGVCRCLAILSDKDAVLCTVPSFSVLLLLIVVHKGPEVVAYFGLWTLLCAVLLALDHRNEARRGLSAVVPAVARDQEIKLPARGLAGVMGFSLISAVVLFYALSGDPQQENGSDGWVTIMASRLTQLALNLPDVSVNAGPERQIDFTSGPALPTRAELWLVKAERVDGPGSVRPQYWRMFTLSRYDGRTWSQAGGQGNAVPLAPLPREQQAEIRGGLFRSRRVSLPRQQRRRLGYNIESESPPAATPKRFGSPLVRVRQYVSARVPNTGYVPTLPGAGVLVFENLSAEPPNTIRVRDDASVDVGVMRLRDQTLVVSSLPPLREYGLAPLGSAPGPPLTVAESSAPRSNAGQALELSPSERSLFLQLPPQLPARVSEWAQRALKDAGADESDYRRASRLMAAMQVGTSYTLRPPLLPEGRDATDHFLFDSRRGYCTYFAGALAVLCRTVGIPSRIVSGFTNPEWIQTNNSIYRDMALLRESNAHAWVEVWVPGWGWATLDPTPPDDRGDNVPSLLQSWEDFRDILWDAVRAHSGPVSVAVLALCSVAALAGVASRRRARGAGRLALSSHEGARRVDREARRAIGEIYLKASRQGSRRFRAAAAWETPFEWSRQAEQVLDLDDPEPLRELADLYARARFSPHPMGPDDVARALDSFNRLSWNQREAAPAASQAAPRAANSQENEGS